MSASRQSRSAAAQLVDAETARRADALGLQARTVVEGYKVGEHRSPLKGFAIEFAQHREYVPGDDPRHLDWKVYGRSERLFVKQYEQDTNFVAQFLIDRSASMNFASEGQVSKMQTARVLAACLAHVVVRQRDAFCLGFFGHGDSELHPKIDTPQRLPRVLELLAGTEAAGAGNLAADFARFLPRLRRRSIVLIASDFLNEAEHILDLLPQLRFQQCEVIVFHLLDPAERSLPYTDRVRFEGLEGEAALTTWPEAFANAYASEVSKFCERLRKGCEQLDAHYLLIDTSKPLHEALGEYLALRQRVHR